jgi:hypothetical protein
VKSLYQNIGQKLTAPIRPASNSFRGFFWSAVCFLLPGTGASLTLVSSWDPPFRKGFCLGPAAGEAAEEVEVVADESAMGADGKLGLVFWAHQSLSPLGPLACTRNDQPIMHAFIRVADCEGYHVLRSHQITPQVKFTTTPCCV